MVGRGDISGLEMMFLSLTAAGLIGLIVTGLQLAFRVAGWWSVPRA